MPKTPAHRRGRSGWASFKPGKYVSFSTWAETETLKEFKELVEKHDLQINHCVTIALEDWIRKTLRREAAEAAATDKEEKPSPPARPDSKTAKA